ncbi:MAG: hypothetical protein HXY34_13275 [Candidatus Thorarchaeota archaeon]|nr:hypothetical protein [Candidatus Thorarchaeota archaeon]
MEQVSKSADLVDITEDWAYWIDPETLKMPKARGRIPSGSLLIVKSRTEDTLTGRSFVSTAFYLVRPEAWEKRTKKEASTIIGGYVVAYMKRRGAWPPNTQLARELKNGDVELHYAPSQYDTFTLKLSRNMVDSPVIDFLDSLEKAAESTEDTSAATGVRWAVEPAKSSRSTCRACQKQIQKDELRIGEPVDFEGHTSYRWYHVACAAKRLGHVDITTLQGHDALSETHQAQLRAALDDQSARP